MIYELQKAFYLLNFQRYFDSFKNQNKISDLRKYQDIFNAGIFPYFDSGKRINRYTHI